MIKPYILLNTEAQDAINHYIEAFNGEIVTIRYYGDMPVMEGGPKVAEEMKKLVLHSQLKLTESGYIFISDSQRDLGSSERTTISVELEDEVAGQKAWDTLKKEGTVFNELSKSFFAAKHGSLKDKFGVTWMFTIGQN